MDLPALSVAELQAHLRSREISPVEALTALEARIAAIDPMIHGYLSRDSDQLEDLLAALQDASPDAPMPLMIEVQGEVNAPATKQMRITRLLQTGWRTDSVVAGVN